MDIASDPEIFCVFCGLGFSSVENVESHILQNHISNSIDQIENRKACGNYEFVEETLTDETYSMSNEVKETVAQKKFKSDNPSSDHIEINRPKSNKIDSQIKKKSSKLTNVMQKESNHFKETGFHLENNYLNNLRASTLLNISETIANVVENKGEKNMNRSLRCQNCDKQFTLSNNLSRHRRLYCSSLKEANVQNNFCQNGVTKPNKVITSPSIKSEITNKPGDISKDLCDSDPFLVNVKKDIIKSKIGKSLLKHKCQKCYKRFMFKLTQIIHLQTHEISDRRKWMCTKCGFRYSNKQILLHHFGRRCGMVSNPASCFEFNDKSYSELLVCHYCEMIFSDPIYMKMHQIRVCQKFALDRQKSDNFDKSSTDSVESRIKLKESMFKVSKDQISSCLSKSKDLSSTSCLETFETESNSRSPESQTNVTVKVNNMMNNSQSQKFHWHNYNDEIQQKSFQCEVCKKSFSSRSSLSNHIKSHYSSRGQPFTCRDCNRRFVNLLSLQDHRREMCSQKSNETDQKIVYSLSNFNGVSQVPIWPNITNTNSGNQPVTCLHCNGVFYDRLELEEHALSKHSNEKGNILCLLCDRSFTTNMALRVHLTKSHGFANGGCPGVSQNLPPMPKLETNYHTESDFPIKKRRKEKRLYDFDKEYTCDNCHRNFSTGQALGNHKRACLNIPNDFISVESQPQSQNSKSNSKLHSIESLIFDNSNIRPSFANDKNVFLAFN